MAQASWSAAAGGVGGSAPGDLRVHHALDLRDRDDGQEADEEEEEGEEEAEGAEEDRVVPERQGVHAPGRGEEVAVERRHDDDVALEPHPDVHEDRDDEEDPGVAPHRLPPEHLRDDRVAGEHDGVGPPVRAERAVLEDEALPLAPRVPGHEELGGVGEADEHARQHQDLRHVLHVVQGDVVLHPEVAAHEGHQRDDHREAREDGADDEVGREDRRVPARHDRRREVERDDRVDREDQRRRERGEDHVGRLVVPPRPVGSGPAEAHRVVDLLPPRVGRPVPHGGEVGEEPHVPEREGDEAVGGDREDVPRERRVEVDPERAAGVRVGDEPVGEPGAPEVDDREDAGAGDGEERHRLRGAVDAGPPLLAEQDRGRPR